MFHRSLWLCIIILILIGTGLAADVPFVFDESASGVAGYSSDQIEQASSASSDLAGVPLISAPSDSEVLEFPITGGSGAPDGKVDKNVGELKIVLNSRIEPDNPTVRHEALLLAGKHPGDYTIEQVSAIYSYLKSGDGAMKGWSYVRDPRGVDCFNNASESLGAGKEIGCAGIGDCDDFAILMSALVESIGGSTRIILAHNNSTGGHAYTEVFLGGLDAKGNQVEDITEYLRQEFRTEKIYTHIDTDTKDVWLNLDWGTDEMGNAHPGGPFFQGDKHIVLCMRDRYGKTPLKLPEGYVKPGEMIAVLGNLYNPKYSVAFSPDGRTIAAGCKNGSVMLWDASSHLKAAILEGSSSVNSVAFSPDGRTLATGCSGGIVRLWDVASRTEVATLDTYNMAGWNRPIFYVVDHRSYCSYAHETIPVPVNSVVFSPNGRILASGSEIGYPYQADTEEMVTLWDVANRTRIGSLADPRVNSMAFSPDGQTLATSGSYSGTVKLWNVESRTEVANLTGHSDRVSSVAFSPDGRTLASGSSDSTVKLWDVASLTEVATLDLPNSPVSSVAFSSDGQTLVTGSYDSTLKLWNVVNRTEVATLEGHSDYVTSVAFSPDGRTLASGSEDHTVNLWDVLGMTKIATLEGHSEEVKSVTFSPDSQTLASGSEDDTVILWDVASQKEVGFLGDYSGGVRSVAFSPDGRTLASGLSLGSTSSDDTVKLWDVKGRTFVATLAGHPWHVDSVAFSPDGQILATASADSGTVKLWDIESRTGVANLTSNSSVSSVAFSPDGRTLASGSEDDTVKLWDISSMTEVAILSGHSDDIEGVAFSPDGQTLASGSADNTVKLWDVSSRMEVVTLSGHSNMVSSIAFSPDGRTLASGSYDGTIRLWRVA